MNRKLVVIAGLVVSAVVSLGPVPVPASAAAWSVTNLSEGATAAGLAQSLVGSGLTVTNVSYVGDPLSAGTFSNSAGSIGLTTGVVLSTGEADDAAGPNQLTGNTEDDIYNPPSVSDASLDGLLSGTGAVTEDATVLQFTVVPTSPQLNISYVFASEEYDEYVGAGFDDVFGFFVNGTNCATIPGSTSRVSVDSINSGDAFDGPATNPLFHRRNLQNDDGVAPYDTEFDGFTVPLTCRATVTSGQATTIKLAIADVGDSILDSAVFLQAGGITFTTAGPCKGVNPGRIADTRNGIGTGIQKRLVQKGETISVKVSGEKDVPSSALAAILNVTVDHTEGTGYLTVYPSNERQPGTSSVNFTGPGGTASNSVVTNVGPDGYIKIYASEATDIIVDVFGFCGPTGTDRLVPMSPIRVADTRTGIGVRTGMVDSGGTLEVTLAGQPGVPASFGMAILNVTAVDGEDWGYFTVWPANQDKPDSSNVNYLGKNPTPNTVIVPVSPDGKIKIFTLKKAHVLVDMMGWMGTGGIQEYNLFTPQRIYDSRQASFNPTGVKLTDAGMTLQVAGANGIPAIARTVILNVTVDQPADGGYLTVWPAGGTMPATSNVNYVSGQTVPNSVVVGLSSTGKIDLSSFQSTHIIVDVVGWFS